MIREVLAEVSANHPNPSETSDRIDLDTAISLLGKNGYPVKKAHIYKLTSHDKIPHKKVGKRLVFSKSALLEWLEEETYEQKSREEQFKEMDERAGRRQKRKVYR